jgi:hypothetical protein
MSAPAFTDGELIMLSSVTPSANGSFHLYVADADGRKIAALWGDPDEKLANGYLWTAAAEMLEQLDLFICCLEYEIRVSENKGDDEGARLKSLTLSIARSVAAKARGEQ